MRPRERPSSGQSSWYDDFYQYEKKSRKTTPKNMERGNPDRSPDAPMMSEERLRSIWPGLLLSISQADAMAGKLLLHVRIGEVRDRRITLLCDTTKAWEALTGPYKGYVAYFINEALTDSSEAFWVYTNGRLVWKTFTRTLEDGSAEPYQKQVMEYDDTLVRGPITLADVWDYEIVYIPPIEPVGWLKSALEEFGGEIVSIEEDYR